MPNPKKTSDKIAQKYSPELTKSQTIILIAAVVVAALLYFLKGYFVAAKVNGTPITRWSIVSQLEKTGGKQTLDSLITKELILQEAKKRGISLSSQDIDQEMNKIEANVKQQGGNFEEILKAQGMSREDLREQVEVQKLVEKMFVNQLKVSQEEIKKFIVENEASLPQNSDEESIKTSVKQQLQQQKLNQSVQQLIENLKKAAKIEYFVTY